MSSGQDVNPDPRVWPQSHFALLPPCVGGHLLSACFVLDTMASASNAVSQVICPLNMGEGGSDSERLNRFSEITQLERGRAPSDPVCLIRALAGLNSIKFSGISCGGWGLEEAGWTLRKRGHRDSVMWDQDLGRCPWDGASPYQDAVKSQQLLFTASSRVPCVSHTVSQTCAATDEIGYYYSLFSDEETEAQKG